MINYIAMTGDPAAVKVIFRSAKDKLESTLTFSPAAWFSKISANGAWAVIACAETEEELARRVACSQRGFFLINGPVLRFGDRFDIAAAALEAAADADIDSIFEGMVGAFNCTFLTQRNGFSAFADFSGVYPVYSRSSSGFVAVSNRASALASLEPVRSLDLTALSWLIGHSNIFGPQSPYSDVFNITAGCYFRARIGSTSSSVLRFERQVWPSAFNEDLMLDDLPDDDWDEIADELVKNVAAAANQIEGSLRLSLTGGKDSRLTLALALGAGLKAFHYTQLELHKLTS